MARKVTISIIIVLFFILISSIQEFVEFYTDLLWFENLGFEKTFWTLFTANIKVITIFTTIFIILFSVNFLFLRYFSKNSPANSPLYNQIRASFPKWEKRINLILFFAALLLLSFIMGRGASNKWQEAYLALNSISFNQVDPIFQRDLSFYIFRIPIFNFFINWMYGAIVLTTLFSVFYHVLNGAISVSDGISIQSHTWGHISFLAGLLIFIKALSFKLSNFLLLNTKGGVVYGAGFTDVNARILGNNILFYLSLILAIILWVNIIKKSLKLPLYSFAVLVVTWLIFLGLIPSSMQKFSVEPNELKKENPFIAFNIDFTRKAYNLDNIKEEDYPISDTLDPKILKQYQDTLDNIRLWDYRPLKQTFSQLQEIRLYYKFHDVDIDRYTIENRTRLVMLSGRELDIRNLPKNAQTWINIHMKYTHGYGLVLCPVNEVTREGLPNLLVKDIPPVSKEGLEIKRPEIYYGELTDHYVLAGSKEKEFDYPMGDENRYTSYQGKGGVSLKSFWRKILFAIRMKTTKMLFAKGIDENTRILFNRNIKERIRTIAPFLHIDQDPYLVITEGRLKYMVDAYTVTDRYPYAEPFPGSDFNYIRNSVKVVVDAYDGTVKFYLFDLTDPIIQVYAKIFPDIFLPKEKIPDSIMDHIRYPVTLFNVQMSMYRSYHMKNNQVFYNKEDLWEFPSEIYEDSKIPMESYYQVMHLPGHKNAEFSLMIPFTPRGKNNLVSLAAALSSRDKYGQILVYKMPKQKLTYGPMQFEARVDQDPDISKQLSLWSQKGSRVIRGNTLIIPIHSALLYIEPLYLKAEQSELPELKRIIVSLGSKMVMESSLSKALNLIFSSKVFLKDLADGSLQQAGFTDLDLNSSQKILIEKAKSLYKDARKMLKNGDLAGFAKKIDDLGNILEKL